MENCTPSSNSEIAVLQVQMVEMQRSSNRVETKLDSMQVKIDTLIETLDSRYVTHIEYELLKKEVIAFKKQYWLSHTLTAVLTAIIIATVEYVVLGALRTKG